jgi:hypothetical protein
MFHLLFVLASMQQAMPARTAGTYAVTFCSSECRESDTSLVLASGVLVLDSMRVLVPAGSEDRAACFRIEKRKNVYGYLAVVSPARTTWWMAGADSIGFTTYRTSDASHEVSARLVRGGFQGKGSSDGDGIAEIDVADEYVIGRRTGPPNQRTCGLLPPAGPLRRPGMGP